MTYCRFVLFFVYYPEDEKVLIARSSEDDLSSVRYSPETVEAPGWTWSKRILVITITTMTLIVITALFIQSLFGFPSSVSLKFANHLGFVSLVLSFFQFIPQIFKTYKLQEVGALSITAMLMQTPGIINLMKCMTDCI